MYITDLFNSCTDVSDVDKGQIVTAKWQVLCGVPDKQWLVLTKRKDNQ